MALNRLVCELVFAYFIFRFYRETRWINTLVFIHVFFFSFDLLKTEKKHYEKETEKYYSSLEKLLNLSAKKKEPQLQEVFILCWSFLDLQHAEWRPIMII